MKSKEYETLPPLPASRRLAAATCLRASVHTKIKFDMVVESSLVVGLTQAVPDRGLPDAQLIRDLTVLESLRNQLYDSKVLSAGLCYFRVGLPCTL
jgi:hypothetical protein